MVLIFTGYTLFVMFQYDVTFTFPNQRFGEVCCGHMHIILHPLSLLVVLQCVPVMNISALHVRSQSKTQHSTLRQS